MTNTLSDACCHVRARHLLRQLADLCSTLCLEMLPLVKRDGRMVPDDRESPRTDYLSQWLLGTIGGCTAPASNAARVHKKVRLQETTVVCIACCQCRRHHHHRHRVQQQPWH
jgi:hypothetical protein